MTYHPSVGDARSIAVKKHFRQSRYFSAMRTAEGRAGGDGGRETVKPAEPGGLTCKDTIEYN